MTAGEYDVAVIGSGVAGMTVAAMLAKDFGKKVLVLEQAPFIGGRTLSFVGKGNKVQNFTFFQTFDTQVAALWAKFDLDNDILKEN